ncbi:winged helix-turn-helix domain-containing protein [Pseudoxanthomonas beigongshangi]
MDKTARTLLRIGDWEVDTVSGVARRGHDGVALEARALALLLRLAEQPGEVVSLDALLARGWPDVIVSPDSVYQAITSLRRQLGDDSRQPRYIATVPRLGYRLIAEVAVIPPVAEPARDTAQPVAADQADSFVLANNADRRLRGGPARLGWLLAVALLAVSGVAAYRLIDRVDADAPVASAPRM